MQPQTRIEERVRRLERALSRSRLLALALGLSALLLLSTGWSPWPQEAPTGEIRTQRLVLTNELDVEGVVLVAGPQSSLVIRTPGGEEILRLGGSPARPIRR